jgi:HAD superfamily hydrolase (TIGR01509 family)
MEAVLFDWDGTLADSLEGFYQANAVVMAELGIPFDRDRYRAAYTPDWRVFYRRLGIGDDELEAANARWNALFQPDARPLAGAREAVAALAAAGVRLGIVTASGHRLLDPQVARFGLDGLLEVRICGDDLPVHKPDPAPLRLALDRLALTDRPAAVAYVGDAPDDMRMAVAVGARPIGIRSMLGDADELVAAGAAEVHDSVADWVATILGRPIAAA